MPSLIPDRVYSSVFAIDGAALAAEGITLLLADLDNTLARYGQPDPEQRVADWNRDLRAAGVELFLLSNNRRPIRVRRFAEALGVPYLGGAGKPGSGGFRRAMERMGRTPGQTAMVGDQIFTDIWGAKRAGVKALLVEPVFMGRNPGRRLRYIIETPFRNAGRRAAHE